MDDGKDLVTCFVQVITHERWRILTVWCYHDELAVATSRNSAAMHLTHTGSILFATLCTASGIHAS